MDADFLKLRDGAHIYVKAPGAFALTVWTAAAGICSIWLYLMPTIASRAL
jgi:hypothetical protein